jgi:hypothetical protein
MAASLQGNELGRRWLDGLRGAMTAVKPEAVFRQGNRVKPRGGNSIFDSFVFMALDAKT